MTALTTPHQDWLKVDSLKARALDVATELIASRGADGVNVRDIAEFLNTGPSSLYYYFKSKDALLAEVAAQGFRRLEVKVAASLNDGRGWAPIRACGAAYFGFMRDNPMLYKMMYSERLLAQFEVVREAERAASETFARLIATGIDGADAEDGALALWAFGRGVAALAIASETNEAGSGRELTRRLVHGLEVLMGRRIRGED